MNLGKQKIKANWRQPAPVESRDWGGAEVADPEMCLNEQENLTI